MIRRALPALAALLLAACADHPAAPPVVRTVTVYVPTPVPCIDPDSPAPPAYADTPEALKAARDYAERDGLVKGEWATHQARESYLETLRSICMKAGPHV